MRPRARHDNPSLEKGIDVRSNNTTTHGPIATLGDERMPARFWNKIDSSDSECWLWTAYCDDDGYPRYTYDRVQRAAHRISYSVLIRPITGREVAHHACRTRRCVNPHHIEPMEKEAHDEMHRAEEREVYRVTRAVKSHCPDGHEMTPENTQWNRARGTRLCRTCRCRQRTESYYRVKARRAS